MTTAVRRLILLRHAKASQEEVRDHERPLTPRGRQDAAAAGRWLLAADLRPGLVRCSTALRTRETWAGIQASGLDAKEVRYEDAIYAASVTALLAVVRSVPDAINTAMLIGHAPGVPDLVSTLSGGGDAAARQRLQGGFPTCGLAVLHLPGRWAEATDDTAELVQFQVLRAEE